MNFKRTVVSFYSNKLIKMNDVFSLMSWIGLTSAFIMAFAIDNTWCRLLGR